MIALLALFVVFCLVVLVAGLRLAPMFGGNINRLETLLADEFHADRYRPMERLLRESDWEYLSSQPGFSRSRVRAIRAQRRGLFRRYLGCLSGDFAAICLLVRALMVQSTVSRPDLAKALVRHRVNFSLALLEIELRLVAHAAGIGAVQIDISGLTRALEELGECARSLQTAAQPSLA